MNTKIGQSSMLRFHLIVFKGTYITNPVKGIFRGVLWTLGELEDNDRCLKLQVLPQRN